LGITKQRWMEHQDMERAAEAILVKSGCLDRCEVHEVSIEKYADLTPAYKLANARISSGELELPVDMNRRDFTDMLKRVAEMAADECPMCAKLREE